MFEPISTDFDTTGMRLVPILGFEHAGMVNTVDIEVEDDNSFTLTNGLISHNSARLSIQSARGKNKLIGSFSLRGKPLNVFDSEVKDIVSNNEFANMMIVTGLQLGVKVIAEDLPPGEWVELDIDGEKILVNENDEILINGQWYEVKNILLL